MTIFIGNSCEGIEEKKNRVTGRWPAPRYYNIKEWRTFVQAFKWLTKLHTWHLPVLPLFLSFSSCFREWQILFLFYGTCERLCFQTKCATRYPIGWCDIKYNLKRKIKNFHFRWVTDERSNVLSLDDEREPIKLNLLPSCLTHLWAIGYIFILISVLWQFFF